jgi:hypothetical protein
MAEDAVMSELFSAKLPPANREIYREFRRLV